MTTPAVSDHSKPLTDEALEWLIRLSAEPCPPAELQAFQKWARQSPAHRAAYAEVSNRMTWLERVASTDIDTRNAALRYRAKPRNRAAPPWMKLATAASVLLALGLATFSEQGWYGNSRHYQAARGSRETVKLADGSTLELNTDSEVKVRINRWQRAVDVLKGEVYFNVAHDAGKPFVVAAGAGRSIDIGTEFEVYREAEHVTVAVREGSVRVEAKQSRDLIASQAVAYNQNGDFIEVPAKFNLAAVSAWRRGKLIFDNRRLDEVLAEMGRYHNAQLKLADNKVSGTFFIDRLESNLSTIANSLNLIVHHVGTSEIVLAKR
jgi:transmembrane sensor